MATLLVTENSAEAKFQKITMYIVALDAQKAFDVVSHSIAFRKLLIDGTDRDTVASIIAMYTDATEFVVWEGTESKPYKVS